MNKIKTLKNRAQNAVFDAYKIINDNPDVSYNGGALEAVNEWTQFTSGTFGIDTSSIHTDVTVNYKHSAINEDKSFLETFKVAKGSTNKEFTKEIIASGFKEIEKTTNKY